MSVIDFLFNRCYRLYLCYIKFPRPTLLFLLLQVYAGEVLVTCNCFLGSAAFISGRAQHNVGLLLLCCPPDAR